MWNYALKRLLAGVGIMWAVATLVFFAMRLVPADPATVVLGDYATPAAIAAFYERTGLDQPLHKQYWTFLAGVVQGDLGNSLVNNQPVTTQLMALFPYTLSLALASLLIGAAIGIPVGITTAIHRGRWIDGLGRVFALVGFSLPAFYLGIILLMVFSLWLRWFPIVHTIQTGALTEHLHKLVLPALSLGIIQAAYITRLTRSSMLEVMSQDFVRTAHAKGLGTGTVNYKHVLPNIMIPVITAMGIYTGTILGGAILTETVFNRPGIGKLLVGAIATRDYPLIQSGLMMFAFVVVVVNILVDLSYALFDPRVKYD